MPADLTPSEWLQRITGLYVPLYTLSELAQHLDKSVDFLGDQRSPLVQTGYADKVYTPSGFFDQKLGELYPTRVCLEAIAERSDATRISLIRAWGRTVPRVWEKPARSADSDESRCSLEEAGPVLALTENELEIVEQTRPKIFTVKQSVLTVLANHVEQRTSARICEGSVAAIADELTLEEVRFLRRVDGEYTKFNEKHWTGRLLGGGIHALRDLIFHVEGELTLGAMTSTRAALADVLTPQERSELEWYDYSEIRDSVDEEKVRSVMAVHDGLQVQHADLWSDFTKRFNRLLGDELRTQVRVNVVVPGRHASVLRKEVQSYAQHRADVLVTDDALRNDHVSTDLSPDEEDTYAFQRHGDMWQVVFEGESGHFGNLVGMRTIAFLLWRPTRSFGPTELRSHVRPEYAVSSNLSRSQIQSEGLSAESRGYDKILHEDVIREYRMHLEVIEGALLSADEDQKLDLIAEQSTLRQQLAAGTYHGRPREIGDQAEKDRKALVNTYHKALKTLSDSGMPSLAKHLRDWMTVGVSCVYSPQDTPNWVLDSL